MDQLEMETTYEDLVNKLRQMDPKQLHHYLFFDQKQKQSRHNLQSWFFSMSIDVIRVLLNINILKWLPDQIIQKRKFKREHNREIPFLMLVIDVFKNKKGDLRGYYIEMINKVKDEHPQFFGFFLKYLEVFLTYFYSQTPKKIKYVILMTLSNGYSVKNKQSNLQILCNNWRKPEDKYPNLLLMSAPSLKTDFIEAVDKLEKFLNDKYAKISKIKLQRKRNKKILTIDELQSHNISSYGDFGNTLTKHQQNNVPDQPNHGNQIEQQNNPKVEMIIGEYQQQNQDHLSSQPMLSQQNYQADRKDEKYQIQDLGNLIQKFKQPRSEDSPREFTNLTDQLMFYQKEKLNNLQLTYFD